METQEDKTEKPYKSKHTTLNKYLIRKYGKEPRITEKEMKLNQWNWH